MGAAFAFEAVTKVYPPATIALKAVTLSVETGAIHAFVGENGAGKSTLMKLLSGEISPDSGVLRVGGREVRYSSAADAMSDGIGMVHQEILLVSELTVWENVILGVEPVRAGLFGFGRIDRSGARAQVEASIRSNGFELDPNAIVGDLTVAARQKVEICKLLYRGMQIVVLDEPTAVLAPQEVPELFAELRRLRDSGRTICFISHHLDEVLELCDTVTVLRDGAHIATLPTAGTSPAALARLMVERDIVSTAPPAPQTPGEVVLEMRDLTWSEPGITAALGPIDLKVRRGEIVGIAGVDGNGQVPLVECLTGVRTVTSGALFIDGRDCTSVGILDRRRLLSYVPAERKTAGSALEAPLVDNITMTHHRLTRRFSTRIGPFRLLNRSTMREAAEQIRNEFDVASASIGVAVRTLSGGNQQKLILGRELLEERPLIVLDQPTRGLDVGSIEFVHARILALRNSGHAVLLISADLDELQRLSDRVVVLRRGRVALNAPNQGLDRQTIGLAMLEGSAPKGSAR